jgi:hypothetical protein
VVAHRHYSLLPGVSADLRCALYAHLIETKIRVAAFVAVLGAVVILAYRGEDLTSVLVLVAGCAVAAAEITSRLCTPVPRPTPTQPPTAG